MRNYWCFDLHLFILFCRLMLVASFKHSPTSMYGCVPCFCCFSLLLLLNRWDHLTHKNFELERACMDLESEIAVLQHQAKLRLELKHVLATANFHWLFFFFSGESRWTVTWTASHIIIVCRGVMLTSNIQTKTECSIPNW